MKLIPPQSVIVLDNAKYHNSVVENVPTMANRRTELHYGIRFDSDMKKVALIHLIQLNRHETVYKTGIIAETASHSVLRLPIELVWAGCVHLYSSSSLPLSSFCLFSCCLLLVSSSFLHFFSSFLVLLHDVHCVSLPYCKVMRYMIHVCSF